MTEARDAGETLRELAERMRSDGPRYKSHDLGFVDSVGVNTVEDWADELEQAAATLRAEHDRLRAENERQAEEIARLREQLTRAMLDHSASIGWWEAETRRQAKAAESQVQALQAQVDSMVAPEELRQWKAEAERQRESVQVLRQALESYADLNNWVSATAPMGDALSGWCSGGSGWDIAKAALAPGEAAPKETRG